MRASTGNLIIDSLPEPARGTVLASADAVRSPRGHMLHEVGQPIDFAYFPVRGLISSTTVLGDGTVVEAMSVGAEGVAGIALIFGVREASIRDSTQIGAELLRIPATALLQLASDIRPLGMALLLYANFVVRLLAQGVACNRLHGIEARLARWLLGTRDRIVSNRLPLTHEFLAQMLGTYRPTVSLALRQLEEAGLITAGRGEVLVLSREGLEAVACECYGVLREQLQAFRAGLTQRH